MKKINFYLFSIIILFCIGCETSPVGPQPLPVENLEKILLEKLINAKDDDLILLPEGTFSFQRPLSLDAVPNITIKGQGMDKTIFSFKNQIEGAEGFIIKKVKGLTLEGFTIQDSKGDALKVQDCENVTLRDLHATWTGGALSTNGGYGLYPVSCRNVLMEKCKATFASDAGIYVGQSRNVIVRNNLAHDNVAGIEIENTQNADVYDNVSRGNTGGILIFDMPDLPQANGFKVKIHNNTITDNNHENFAPKGTVVATVPPGSGVTIMAHKEVEVYDNKISGHNTASIGISSWLFTGLPFKSQEFDPFCSAINIYNNTITKGTGASDMSTDFGKLISAMTSGKSIDVIIDGILNPDMLDEKGMLKGNDRICIRNNGEISFLNLNAGLGDTPEAIAKNMSNDISMFDCELGSIKIEDLGKWIAMTDTKK